MTTREEKNRRVAAAIERKVAMNNFMLAFNVAKDGDADEFKVFLPVCDFNLQSHPDMGMTPLDIPAMLIGRARGEDPFISHAVDIVSRMVSENADIRSPRYKDGYTLLMAAAICGRREIVEALLPYSDALQKNIRGVTAIDIASEYGQQEIAEFIKASILSDNENDELSMLVADPGVSGTKTIDDRPSR